MLLILFYMKARHGISGPFVFADAFRKKIHDETSAAARSCRSVREKFWLDRIMPRIGGNILFIRGHEYAVRFRALVISRGHDAAIIEKF